MRFIEIHLHRYCATFKCGFILEIEPNLNIQIYICIKDTVEDLILFIATYIQCHKLRAYHISKPNHKMKSVKFDKLKVVI